jgi:hypothetical protein
LSIAIRFSAGFIVGFEINSAPGAYLNLYLGIMEVVFYDEDKLED